MKLKAFSAIAAVATVGVMGAALSSSSAQPSEETMVLKMRFREASFQMVDNPPRMTKSRPSESPGDTVVARGWLRDSAGDRAGRAHSTFTVTGGKSPKTTELASATVALADGQIVIQGVIGTEQTDVLPIVGGSGAYEGARGSVAITTGKRAVTFEFNVLP
jgi:hypothetical protein